MTRFIEPSKEISQMLTRGVQIEIDKLCFMYNRISVLKGMPGDTLSDIFYTVTNPAENYLNILLEK